MQHAALTDNHRLVGDLLDEAFPLGLRDVEIERRDEGASE
jgi:hypothetical protein